MTLFWCSVGLGAMIASAGVVSKDVSPCGSVPGCPARVLRFRWSVETVLGQDRTAYRAEFRILETELRMSRRTLGGAQCQ
jgi:serine acetyltransferase